MLTIEKLKEFGANTDEALARCFGKEDFYLKLVNMGLNDGGYEKLAEAVKANDLTAAFEAAHALKGVLGNLSLTPILEPVVEITELLRAKTETDYSPLVEKILQKKKELEDLIA